jgi:type IV pilus assembly protein PilX
MKQMRTRSISMPAQRGAALVIGLILLLVLTVLAISGVNSASLEFFMAGNEQFHQNAFQAAETGIERALAVGTYNPGAGPQDVNGSNTATDTYTARISPQLGGAPQPAIWGNSWNSFSTYHFEIGSTGSSTRNARSVNTQGVAVIAPSDPTVTPGGGLGSQLTGP